MTDFRMSAHPTIKSRLRKVGAKPAKFRTLTVNTPRNELALPWSLLNWLVSGTNAPMPTMSDRLDKVIAKSTVKGLAPGAVKNNLISLLNN
jgi:hypothetical protein